MSRKKFENGDAVEVQADVDKSWEPATYTKSEWRGWHSVHLERDRYIDSMNGAACLSDNPRAYRTRSLAVPTQRLRARR